MYRTTVTVAATGYYHIFALPYITSYAYFNQDTRFELFVDDVKQFNELYKKGITKIKKLFGKDVLLIREMDMSRVEENYQQSIPRFLQTPSIKTEFVYIGDVDSIILDSMITEQHEYNMFQNNLPFSNVLRDDSGHEFEKIGPRLTGLHFTKWDAYFPLPKKILFQTERSAEFTVYDIVHSKNGDFNIKTSFRPMHGFHISDKLHIWDPESTLQIGIHTDYLTNYFRLRESSEWSQVKESFHPFLKSWLRLIDTAIGCVWPNNNGKSLPRPSMINGELIGPGIAKVGAISDILKTRHQFIKVPTQIRAGTRAGEIFDFLNFSIKNNVKKILYIGKDWLSHFLTISESFEKLHIYNPPSIEESYKNYILEYMEHDGCEIKLFDKQNQLEKIIDNYDLIIFSPHAYEIELTKEKNYWNRLNYKGIIGIISSDGTKPSNSNFGEYISNTRILNNSRVKESFCINRVFAEGEEMRVFLEIYEEFNDLLPIDSSNKEIFEVLKTFHEKGNSEEYIKFYEINKNKLCINRKYHFNFIRHLYISKNYDKCLNEIQTSIEDIEKLRLFSARCYRNIGENKLSKESYMSYLKHFPSNTNALIEIIQILINEGDKEIYIQLLDEYSKVTDSPDQLNDWIAKNI